jgi:hypothetical protein
MRSAPFFMRVLLALLAVGVLLGVGPARGAALTNYLENRIVDHLFRATAFTAPTTIAIGLIRATRGTWAASTVYAVNDTIIPTSANGRLYRATAVAGTGTSAASEPTWPTTAGGTVIDNAGANQITWTEQTIALEAGTITEVANAGAYARVTLNPSVSNWKGTGNETAGASAGTSGTAKNNLAITFAAPTANWGLIFGFFLVDSATHGAGNILIWSALTTPKNVNSGDAAPSFAIDALTVQLDD